MTGQLRDLECSRSPLCLHCTDLHPTLSTGFCPFSHFAGVSGIRKFSVAHSWPTSPTYGRLKEAQQAVPMGVFRFSNLLRELIWGQMHRAGQQGAWGPGERRWAVGGVGCLYRTFLGGHYHLYPFVSACLLHVPWYSHTNLMIFLDRDRYFNIILSVTFAYFHHISTVT